MTLLTFPKLSVSCFIAPVVNIGDIVWLICQDLLFTSFCLCRLRNEWCFFIKLQNYWKRQKNPNVHVYNKLKTVHNKYLLRTYKKTRNILRTVLLKLPNDWYKIPTEVSPINRSPNNANNKIWWGQLKCKIITVEV